MSSPSFLRKLIIGRPAFILSHLRFKKIILTGQMAIVVFFLALGYAVFDFASGVYSALPYELGCAFFALVSLLLNRRGKHTAAKVVLALAANLTVYVFATSEIASTELNVFYIMIAIATISGFGYDQRYIAFGFVGFTLLLYLADVYIDLKLIPQLSTDAEYVQEGKMINFISALIAAALIVFALISSNFHSEKALRDNERIMAAKNEELTRLNIELDRFVYSSSHDLIAPLRSILGLITLAELAPDSEESKKYLGMIKDRIFDLQRFIKEMSDYSKNARSAVVFEEIDVKGLFREVLETLRYYPDSHELEVNLDVDDDLTVFSDQTRLKVILSNIVGNCFKYCDRDKKNPFVKITGGRQRALVHIEIADNGLGISEESLPKIFDMFYRAHQVGEGTGLGLYIVKETIDKLGGTIAVDSVVGTGTTFRITLPVNPPK